jgi:hypothetical protein
MEGIMMQSSDQDAATGTPEWLGLRLADLSVKQTAALLRMQAQMLDLFDEMRHECMLRAQSEADLASQTAGKLMGARSLPESATAYREWLNQWMDLLGKDSERFLAYSQKVMAKGKHFTEDGMELRT